MGLEELLEIGKQSQHPRGNWPKVVGQMIDKPTTTNKELLNSTKTKKDIQARKGLDVHMNVT